MSSIEFQHIAYIPRLYILYIYIYISYFSTLSLPQSCGHTRAAAWELLHAFCDARSLQGPQKLTQYQYPHIPYSSRNQHCTRIPGVQYQDRCDQQGSHAACRVNLFSEPSLDLSVLEARQARSTTTLSSMSSRSASSMAMNSGFADIFESCACLNSSHLRWVTNCNRLSSQCSHGLWWNGKQIWSIFSCKQSTGHAWARDAQKPEIALTTWQLANYALLLCVLAFITLFGTRDLWPGTPRQRVCDSFGSRADALLLWTVQQAVSSPSAYSAPSGSLQRFLVKPRYWDVSSLLRSRRHINEL